MSNNADRYASRKVRKSRKTREEKEQTGVEIVVKEKFEAERKLAPVRALTPKQQEYIDAIRNNNIIIVNGLFGTGKTYIASAMAADELRNHRISKIIVARPYVEVGQTAGARPGGTLEKLYPLVRNTLDTIQKRMGYGAFQTALKDGLTGSIEVQEIASIRGRSFDEPSWLIVDEAQLTTPEELLAIVTRVSDNCKLILCGDLKQRDKKSLAGLKWFMDFSKRHNIEGVKVVEFNSVGDIVRGGTVRDIAIGLMKDNQRGIQTPEST